MDHYQQPAFFVRGPSPVARLIFFSALSIVLMAVDARLHYLTEIRLGFAALLHPLEVLVTAPISAVGKVGEFVTIQGSLVIDNRRLREQALRQGAELQRFHTLQAENDHLRGLLGVAPAMPQPARLGEVVHAGRDPFTRKVIVNLGSQQGIATGQAVVDELGVIGQVTRVYSFSSEVTLVTDKDLAVPVQVERNGLRAITFGNSRTNAIDLPYLPVNVDVREGDMLVTSGIDGVYPAGLAVAKVAHIVRQADSPFARITCVPVAGIDSHRQVLLVALAANIPPLLDIAQNKPLSQSRSRHAPRKP
jgi:rod shape-determining protein MreC